MATTYDVICESDAPELPGEARGAGNRARNGIKTYSEAQAVADDFVARFGHLPDVRVLIYDRKANRSVVIHEAAA